jgi:hypothetical protein
MNWTSGNPLLKGGDMARPLIKKDQKGEILPARTEIPKMTDQRLGRASLIRGNVADSHAPGNNTPETRLPG